MVPTTIEAYALEAAYEAYRQSGWRIDLTGEWSRLSSEMVQRAAVKGVLELKRQDGSSLIVQYSWMVEAEDSTTASGTCKVTLALAKWRAEYLCDWISGVPFAHHMVVIRRYRFTERLILKAFAALGHGPDGIRRRLSDLGYGADLGGVNAFIREMFAHTPLYQVELIDGVWRLVTTERCMKALGPAEPLPKGLMALLDQTCSEHKV